MALKSVKVNSVKVNRAPVLTLWAAIVAERLGFDRDEALTLGRVLAGLDAYSKGRALGLFTPRPKTVREMRNRLEPGGSLRVELLHRAVPAVQTPGGIRALSRGKPVSPESVQRYLESKFGEALPAVEKAMKSLARALPPEELAREAWRLYESFRPEVPSGVRGWGAVGTLDLDRIEALARAATAARARQTNLHEVPPSRRGTEIAWSSSATPCGSERHRLAPALARRRIGSRRENHAS
jgi:hypothetical protein